MPFDGYSGDFNWTVYTPIDSTGDAFDSFRSAYKNIRFGIQPTQQYQLKAQDMANLPGLANTFYGDTSLWFGLMKYNGISDPLSEIAVGVTLLIPSKADIIKYLSRQSTNSQLPVTI